jgi:hypothetical protein
MQRPVYGLQASKIAKPRLCPCVSCVCVYAALCVSFVVLFAPPHTSVRTTTDGYTSDMQYSTDATGDRDDNASIH